MVAAAPLRQLLFVITLLCVGHVIHDLGDTMTAGVDRTWIAASPDGIPIALPLVLGKCLVSCCGAVHAEYFLQHKETKQVPLWITQVHFKTATIIGALTVALFMGNVCERILSDRWHNDIFSHLPNDVSAGDPRIPFFGGWIACGAEGLGFRALELAHRISRLKEDHSIALMLLYACVWLLVAPLPDSKPACAFHVAQLVRHAGRGWLL